MSNLPPGVSDKDIDDYFGEGPTGTCPDCGGETDNFEDYYDGDSDGGSVSRQPITCDLCKEAEGMCRQNDSLVHIKDHLNEIGALKKQIAKLEKEKLEALMMAKTFSDSLEALRAEVKP
jgi:hypothetical protein